MPEVHPAAYDSKIEGNIIFTRVDAAMNWMRKNSLWPMPMGLACCAIELMATAAVPFRYLPVRRGGDAIFTAAMRCHDRGRNSDL